MKTLKRVVVSVICICLISAPASAVGGIVESPTLLAQLIKQYEQYVEMLQKAQDQVERLNKVNDALSKANNLVRNSQLNFYNPMDILENLKDTIEGIKSNVNAMARTVKDFDIRDRITFKRIQAKCPEISQKLLEARYQVKDDDGSNRENEGRLRYRLLVLLLY